MIWLELGTTYSSSYHHCFHNFIILCFNKHRLTRWERERERETEREREREREGFLFECKPQMHTNYLLSCLHWRVSRFSKALQSAQSASINRAVNNFSCASQFRTLDSSTKYSWISIQYNCAMNIHQITSWKLRWSCSVSLSVLTAIFPGELGLASFCWS